MMREILFRGKAINRDESYHRTEYQNGEWVYGLVTKLYDEQFKNLPAEMTNTNGISGIEIDYKTIGQYTGMVDKHGTKIFEGDILAFEDTDGELTNYEILWFKNKWVVRESNYNAVDDLDLFFCECSTVIGNIYDNPELLGDEEND
jgi:uncharacterized phage protein (TIGR01671 family)